MRKITNQWSIFQHAMFDYQRVSTSFHLPFGNLSDEMIKEITLNASFVFKCLILHGTSHDELLVWVP